MYPGYPWFGHPKQTYTYDPKKAKDLMKQAGYDARRARTSFLISTSRSGQMLPLPMNEYVQESLREIGIDAELMPIKWDALTVWGRKGFVEEHAQTGAMSISYNFVEPFSAFVRFFEPKSQGVRAAAVVARGPYATMGGEMTALKTEERVLPKEGPVVSIRNRQH